MFLVQNGFSEDLAFALDDVTRAGFAIILSEHNGAEFDFNLMRFKDQK